MLHQTDWQESLIMKEVSMQVRNNEPEKLHEKPEESEDTCVFLVALKKFKRGRFSIKKYVYLILLILFLFCQKCLFYVMCNFFYIYYIYKSRKFFIFFLFKYFYLL